MRTEPASQPLRCINRGRMDGIEVLRGEENRSLTNFMTRYCHGKPVWGEKSHGSSGASPHHFCAFLPQLKSVSSAPSAVKSFAISEFFAVKFICGLIRVRRLGFRVRDGSRGLSPHLFVASRLFAAKQNPRHPRLSCIAPGATQDSSAVKILRLFAANGFWPRGSTALPWLRVWVDSCQFVRFV